MIENTDRGNAGYPPIGDYGLIGDCRSAALISRDGSLDWLCWPRFDSPSIFAAILDRRRGGCFRISPTGRFDTERRYVDETNVLETVFRTASGTVALRDFMPVASEPEKRRTLTPNHQILRAIEGLDGEVEVEVVYEPRPDYARQRPRLKDRGSFGIWCDTNRSILILRSDLPLALSDDRASASGTAVIRRGERKAASLSYDEDAPAVAPLLGEEADRKLDRSLRWWKDWAARCSYEGIYRDAVVRSALVLSLMSYAPSGAVVAAPTTSLPERIGGVRNWDYRFCWLRDASFTVRALLELGYQEEAEAFRSWMLHSTRLTLPELRVVYDVFGERGPLERDLSYLQGYAGSRPVRIGNSARGQFQLDVYGEVIDGIARHVDRGYRPDSETSGLLDDLGHTVCKRWREPDEGIWEKRSGRSHHTHSKVLCWVALDRLIKMHEAGHIKVCADEFRGARDTAREEIESRGYNRTLQSYVSIYDGDEVDAALLRLPMYGYIDGSDPRMRSTSALIHERLARGSLLYRYESRTNDGLPPGEGAFGIASFWLVEAQAIAGDLPAAERAFEDLLSYRNDLGLYAEEIDPETGAALGNFPQAFTHIGLINAALTLAELEGQQPAPAGQMAGGRPR